MSIRVPLVPLGRVPTGTNRSETYRHLVGIALRQKLAPAKLAIEELPTAVIRFSPAAEAQIGRVADEHGLEFKQAFAGLCAEAVKVQEEQLARQAGVAQQITRDLALPFTPKSAQQQQFYANLMVGLKACQVVFAEGSTGIGKSRAMAGAAIAQAREKKTPVILAAPTVAVVEHLFDELHLLDTGGLKIVMLPGATEFVDDVRLTEHLQELVDSGGDGEVALDEGVLDWVNKGAPSMNQNRPLARTLGAGAAWLMDDLRKIATVLPAEEFQLRRRDERGAEASESRTLLAELRERSKEADIILCTHAMLALGQKTRWAVTPAPKVVIVDEGHLFESAVANINSDNLSLYTLRANIANLKRMKSLGKTSIASKALEEARALTRTLRRFESTGSSIKLTGSDSDAEPHLLRQASLELKALAGMLASKTMDGMHQIEHTRRALHNITLSLASEGREVDRVDLSFSPEKRFPSLMCGPSSVGGHLGDIWKTADGGAAIVSATLYVMDAFGNVKCDYLRGVLAAPLGRLSTPLPVVDPSIYNLPVLHTPTAAKALALTPPGKQNSGPEEAWHESVGRTVAEIAQTAAGGTLVLLTAYKDIDAIEQLLPRSGVAEERIVRVKSGVKFSVTEERFRQAHKQGLRPVLLGLGAAWTGIDLKDDSVENDEQDLLLTDLVVVRLPVALNRSNAMLARIERTGMNPIMNETLLMLKQGLGRLIRRPGVQHRRLWVLDGRVFSGKAWVGMTTLTGAVSRMLRQYVNRREF